MYVCEQRMTFWKVIMQGVYIELCFTNTKPEDTPYENGTYLMFFDLGTNFPQVAPKARFITPILHPNVSKQGRVCHSILGRNHLDFIID